jgi:transposase
MSGLEFIPRGERRRRWTVEQKPMIAAESLAPGASPTVVARQYGIGPGQLYNWRRALMAAQPTIGRFAQVDITPRLTTTIDSGTAIAGSASPVAATSRTPGLIEIVLPGGTVVRVDAQIDPRALRRVLATLRG